MKMSTLITVPDDTTDSDGQTEDERWSIVKGRDSLYWCKPSGGRRAEIKLATLSGTYNPPNRGAIIGSVTLVLALFLIFGTGQLHSVTEVSALAVTCSRVSWPSVSHYVQ